MALPTTATCPECKRTGIRTQPVWSPHDGSAVVPRVWYEFTGHLTSEAAAITDDTLVGLRCARSNTPVPSSAWEGGSVT